MSVWDIFNPVVKVVHGITKDVPIIGDALGTITDEMDYQRGREDTHEDMEFQQQLALEQMAQQHGYNMAAMHDQQTFNRNERYETQMFNSNQAQLARDFNASEAAKQRAWEEQMFERENEYNSPQAQMQRLIDAGINPMTFTGENAIASASPGSSASGPSASVSALGSSMANTGVLGLPSASNNPLTAAQVRLQNAQAANLEQSTRANEEKLPLDLKMMSAQLGLAEDELKNLRPAQLQNLEQSTKNMEQQFKVLVQTVSMQAAQTKLFDAQGNLVQKQVDSYADELMKSLAEADSRIYLNNSNARLAIQKIAESVQQIELLKKQGEFIDEQKQGQIIANNMANLEFEFRSKNASQIEHFKLTALEQEAEKNQYQIGIEKLEHDRKSTIWNYKKGWFSVPILGDVLLGVESFFDNLGNVFKLAK